MKKKLTTWLYHHARWLYKFLSGYCYEMNCEVEELSEEIDRLIKKCEEHQEINKIIESRRYREEL